MSAKKKELQKGQRSIASFFFKKPDAAGAGTPHAPPSLPAVLGEHCQAAQPAPSKPPRKRARTSGPASHGPALQPRRDALGACAAEAGSDDDADAPARRPERGLSVEACKEAAPSSPPGAEAAGQGSGGGRRSAFFSGGGRGGRGTRAPTPPPVIDLAGDEEPAGATSKRARRDADADAGSAAGEAPAGRSERPGRVSRGPAGIREGSGVDAAARHERFQRKLAQGPAGRRRGAEPAAVARPAKLTPMAAQVRSLFRMWTRRQAVLAQAICQVAGQVYELS